MLNWTQTLFRRRRDLMGTIQKLRQNLAAYERGWPPGHFYSPIPDLDEIARDEARIFAPPAPTIPGIDIDAAGQLQLLAQLQPHYAGHPFGDEPRPGVRYAFNNPNYSYGEALVLYTMLCHLRPKRVIEVGSGYSSCVILDANERAFAGQIACTFIEPYPDLLKSLLKPGDEGRISIVADRIQTVDPALIAGLEPNDVLFIDSSHVAKTGSDVNYIFFELLPRLRAGVFVHFHDIGYPFEYPKSWVYQGRAWNEAYLLRAFLSYNAAFRIELYNAFIGHFHAEALERSLPLAIKNPGTSIWLSRR